MKFFVLVALVFSVPAFAVDTSNCSMLLRHSLELSTAKGNRLEVSALRAPNVTCWNASENCVQIKYKFSKKATVALPTVQFWLRINGKETSQMGDVQCAPNNLAYSADTSGEEIVDCTASTAVVGIPKELIDFEIAPSVDGQYDTYGYGRNLVGKI